ncbi:Coenzyme F420 hydrogenase/dehydrogenase, beta subunit C-terminal domain [Sulfurimonas sp.]|uniref:Coenzyme F420 hydrogenase/dehydrogenase, beta subunit C-terminal domain n=1 Tax=Sulfurimonas sp. TaxID=2022749 RepID=UPI001A0324E4|nr:Coenzyme F420 hydrogenase/dehydrogenase, beta subunit C-terminal domain [Sulfurimonas sp.]MBE0515264.1 Coenzyme F420 hydrogenase/dehydrogenase, beta subunit C-terminal domain [Sulfurimonas sp.]
MIDKDLKIYDSVCTGCSACTEACAFPDDNGINPIQLIKNEAGLAVPRIDSDICTSCMACYKACPTEDKIFNNDVTFESYREKLGECYFGYSLDNDHRFEAATAGISTEIAAYLRETNQVDGVVSSYQNDANEIITEIFTDSQEVRKTRGSIYRQVSLLNGLAEKIEQGNHKKLLVIGLPCHIEGLKTLQTANKHLRKNVEFITIALFCKQTKTEEFSDFERRLLQAKPNQKINYRGKGWAGVTSVEGGRSLPSTNIKFSLNWGGFAFTPDYCFTCSDPIGVVADISVGDAWLRKYYADKTGSSLFAANSETGKKIIEEMATAKKIYIEKESVDNIIASQNTNYIKFKTSYVNERRVAFGDLDAHSEKVPQSYKRLIKWIKFNKWLYETMVRTKIVDFVPELVLKVYGRVGGKIFGILSK